MKKFLFVTGTRADYGKMKALMLALESDAEQEVYIYVCGMHLLEKYGSTYREVLKDRYKNIYVAFGLGQSQDASVNLGNTICSLSGYVTNVKPNLIVVHGDRMDALAGAAVGALHNIRVAHVEGGELSGTIDESIRHAISKFAHIHFVANEEAKERLIQLGEEENRIFVFGSPDIDIMKSRSLPSFGQAKLRYEIPFENYGILLYHPVTTEIAKTEENIDTVLSAVEQSGKNYIAIYPNNDLGSDIIIQKYKKLYRAERFRVFPSIRFEYFLTFLKNADFIIGNSSAGIRESGIYGIPAIDIGTRQTGRYSTTAAANVQHVTESVTEILTAIENAESCRTEAVIFGHGNSTERFLEIISTHEFWEIPLQKHFIDQKKG